MLSTLEQYRELQKTLPAPARGDKPMEPERFFANGAFVQDTDLWRVPNLEQIAPVNTQSLPRFPPLQCGRRACSHLLYGTTRYVLSQDAEVQQARDTAGRRFALS
jgi:hypothetical protein